MIHASRWFGNRWVWPNCGRTKPRELFNRWSVPSNLAATAPSCALNWQRRSSSAIGSKTPSRTWSEPQHWIHNRFKPMQIWRRYWKSSIVQTKRSGMAQRSIALSPNQPIAHYNLGKILQSQGYLEEAIAAFGKALELDPQFARAYATRGCCHLLLEQYATGWPDYEWRLRTGQIPLTRFPQPLWSGQPLETGTLLVHAEQGIGDEILFASCLPELITRVGKCVFVCHPRLARLMARSFPAVTVMAHAPAADRVPPKLPFAADFQIPSGSLPLHLRPTAESFPKRKRFLIADPEKRCAWRKRFDALGAGLKIGISWRGGGTSEERRRRITTLQQWRGVRV